jgi:hypothetical protein
MKKSINEVRGSQKLNSRLSEVISEGSSEDDSSEENKEEALPSLLNIEPLSRME